MLVGFRSDFIPQYNNSRHVRKLYEDLYSTNKNIFDKSPYEDNDFIFACSKNDLVFLQIAFEGIHLDSDESKKIQKTV